MSMRKGLVVGVNHYDHVQSLFGCVNDALSVKSVLERNSDGTVNFGVKLLAATDSSSPVTRPQLRESIKELFAGESETALFYFAGHGHIESTGGYLLASDARTGDEGIPNSPTHRITLSRPAGSKTDSAPPSHPAVLLNEAISINESPVSPQPDRNISPQGQPHGTPASWPIRKPCGRPRFDEARR